MRQREGTCWTRPAGNIKAVWQVLHTIKEFLLCGRGDFLTAFMDSAHELLGQPVGANARQRLKMQRSLQELLELGEELVTMDLAMLLTKREREPDSSRHLGVS